MHRAWLVGMLIVGGACSSGDDVEEPTTTSATSTSTAADEATTPVDPEPQLTLPPDATLDLTIPELTIPEFTIPEFTIPDLSEVPALEGLDLTPEQLQCVGSQLGELQGGNFELPAITELLQDCGIDLQDLLGAGG